MNNQYQPSFTRRPGVDSTGGTGIRSPKLFQQLQDPLSHSTPATSVLCVPCVVNLPPPTLKTLVSRARDSSQQPSRRPHTSGGWQPFLPLYSPRARGVTFAEATHLGDPELLKVRWRKLQRRWKEDNECCFRQSAYKFPPRGGAPDSGPQGNHGMVARLRARPAAMVSI
jgi:hypothetical protein